MTDKEKTIIDLQKALNSLDVTSDLRLVLIRTIEYLQEEPISNPTPSEKMSVERWKKACEAACCDSNYRSHYGLTETRDDYFVDGVQWADEHPKEEPVSEDLEEASKEWLRPQLDKSYANYGETKMMELTHFDGYAMLDAIEFGVKWKEKQFEKDYTDLCNGIVTAKGIAVKMAYEKGVADTKEQMMEDATDVTVHEDAGGYPYIPQMELYDNDNDVPLAKEGDKYKVVLIKGD